MCEGGRESNFSLTASYQMKVAKTKSVQLAKVCVREIRARENRRKRDGTLEKKLLVRGIFVLLLLLLLLRRDSSFISCFHRQLVSFSSALSLVDHRQSVVTVTVYGSS